MVAPGFLQNPRVIDWLGGLEPAWTLLSVDSYNALQKEPSGEKDALWLASNLTRSELSKSAVARGTEALIGRAAESEGLKLTATGNLSRAVVAEFINLLKWPEFNKDEAFPLHKVINEPDFFPLFYVRHMAQMAKFVRRHRGHLRATSLGKKMLNEIDNRALQAVLFHITFWHTDLSFFGRGLHGTWPQSDIGIVLWSLSVAASDWQTPEILTRLCTIPVNGVLEATWDSGSLVMETRILRTLYWFGLLEHRTEKSDKGLPHEKRLYRKAPLFNRFFTFDVITEIPETTAH
ncbi:MAG: hypothetical protein O3B74_06620 [Proteobacteria bacterium]|jgi:hypothetical protein|nr:hypothetical protein [Pseudomonadota bacterium]